MASVAKLRVDHRAPDFPDIFATTHELRLAGTAHLLCRLAHLGDNRSRHLAEHEAIPRSCRAELLDERELRPLRHFAHWIAWLALDHLAHLNLSTAATV